MNPTYMDILGDDLKPKNPRYEELKDTFLYLISASGKTGVLYTLTSENNFSMTVLTTAHLPTTYTWTSYQERVYHAFFKSNSSPEGNRTVLSNRFYSMATMQRADYNGKRYVVDRRTLFFENTTALCYLESIYYLNDVNKTLDILRRDLRVRLGGALRKIETEFRDTLLVIVNTHNNAITDMYSDRVENLMTLGTDEHPDIFIVSQDEFTNISGGIATDKSFKNMPVEKFLRTVNKDQRIRPTTPKNKKQRF